MSQQQYLKTLQDQIRRLNLVIDRKIMLGWDYRNEAKRHKLLVSKIRKHKNPGFFDKLSSVFNREYA